jgi:2,3-bisphosphoglycerate-independent phosphoglycerate mutase
VGLLSDGGVHSHIQHLFALLEMAKQQKVEKVFVHCFMDGRDTPPNSGRDYVRQLQQKMRELGVGEIATLVGRYYAMDRDNRWERVELAYRALVHGEAETRTDDPIAALQRSYEADVTDEFVKPIVVTQAKGASAAPVGSIHDDDAVIFFNFRADRARQMTYALAAPEFDKFVDAKRPKNLFYVGMTQYDKKWPWLKCVITPEKLEHILAQVFAELQYKNLRTAETEKYAHVTYFFNGGVEKPFSGEERILVPSPKVATYDLKPEMSAAGITDTVVKAIDKGEFDAIIMNYANADMVGHSGKLEAAIKAVEAVDAGLGQIYQALKPRGGVWIITADHGNAETMIDPVTGGPHTYHTTNPVPLILVSDDDKLRLQSGGSLRDIAPTMLSALGQPRPTDMTGTDLRILS